MIIVTTVMDVEIPLFTVSQLFQFKRMREMKTCVEPRKEKSAGFSDFIDIAAEINQYFLLPAKKKLVITPLSHCKR